jgi:hypothetical protein
VILEEEPVLTFQQEALAGGFRLTLATRLHAAPNGQNWWKRSGGIGQKNWESGHSHFGEV